jgi:hypothetical protein
MDQTFQQELNMRRSKFKQLREEYQDFLDKTRVMLKSQTETLSNALNSVEPPNFNLLSKIKHH